MKYSPNFERDYNFYLKNIDNFTVSGKASLKFQAIHNPEGKSAKEVFWLIDTNGKNVPTREPELLNKLLRCKAGVNMHIKELWAEGMLDGTTLPSDLEDMKKEYDFPDWVIIAIQKQRDKLLKNGKGNWYMSYSREKMHLSQPIEPFLIGNEK